MIVSPHPSLLYFWITRVRTEAAPLTSASYYLAVIVLVIESTDYDYSARFQHCQRAEESNCLDKNFLNLVQNPDNPVML